MTPEDLRLEIYRSFSLTGEHPDLEALVPDSGERQALLSELVAARHIVLNESGTRIVLAHPFSSIPMGFSVMGKRTLWWGGCAWDSFAIPHLVPSEPEVLVATTCPSCGRPHAWVVGREAPPTGDQVAHFLVPTARIWDDVVRTCSNQRVFCDRDCVTALLARSGEQEGSIFDLSTLWRLASRWYDGRLERGYARREPADARAYFRDVGLRGTFWGLN